VRVLRSIPYIDTHTGGEPTRIVHGGVPVPLGKTMEARRRWMAEHADSFRRFVLQEPRGHDEMFGALLIPPVDRSADYGVLFVENAGYLGMCGHGTIGVAAALSELGWVTGDRLILDAPAGRVTCRIDRPASGPTAVTVQNVASYYHGPVEADNLPVDLAFGGNLFALVDADVVGRPIDRGGIPDLVSLGLRIRDAVNRLGPYRHPGTGAALSVGLVEFYDHGAPPRNLVVFGHGQVDRSPCGTGTSAKMAYLHAIGRLDVGEPYRYRSVLGSEFTGRIIAETAIGGRPGVVPEITGTAHVTGLGTLVLTDGDPFPDGFTLRSPTGDLGRNSIF